MEKQVKPKKVTRNILQNCINEMPRMGLYPTPDQLRPIIDRDQELVKRLNSYYKGSTGEGGLDTWERELVGDAVSIHFVGEHTPINGDGQEYAVKFYDRLFEAAKQAGWKTQDDIDE